MKTSVSGWGVVVAPMLACWALAGCHPAAGTEVTVFASGKPKSEVRLKRMDDGRMVRDGWYRSRHENGRIHEEGLYVSGKMHGVWTIWDARGRKRGHQQYLEGRRHGRWFAWHADGRLASRGQYQHGKKTGVWFIWNEAGTLIDEQHYKDGILLP
ncbi:MAG: toxin-antitoxin system YwqK family antitoxin [Phycisphaerae bacterium]